MQSIGDMAQALVLRHQNTQVRQHIDRLGFELSTGVVRDKAKHLAGDMTALATLDRTLSVLDGFRIATTEAAHVTKVMQNALGNIQDRSEDMSLKLIQTDLLNSDALRETLAGEALAALGAVMGDLNQSAAGRMLFGGVATDRTSIVEAESLMTDLHAQLAGQTTLAGIQDQLNAWFDTPGGGFETQTYLGSQTSLAPIKLSPSDSAALNIRADDPVFRETMKSLALAAISSDLTLNFSQDLRSEMLSAAGSGLLQTQLSLTGLRAGLGALEQRIEETVTRNSAEKTTTQLARLDLIGADPYETAAQLENAQLQLESLYTVTVRASRLSLAEFLR